MHTNLMINAYPQLPSLPANWGRRRCNLFQLLQLRCQHRSSSFSQLRVVCPHLFSANKEHLFLNVDFFSYLGWPLQGLSNFRVRGLRVLPFSIPRHIGRCTPSSGGQLGQGDLLKATTCNNSCGVGARTQVAGFRPSGELKPHVLPRTELVWLPECGLYYLKK